jgi:hypothetical protein
MCSRRGVAGRLAELSTGIWRVYDGVQPLQSLERVRNLAANLRDSGGIAGAARTGARWTALMS